MQIKICTGVSINSVFLVYDLENLKHNCLNLRLSGFGWRLRKEEHILQGYWQYFHFLIFNSSINWLMLESTFKTTVNNEIQNVSHKNYVHNYIL